MNLTTKQAGKSNSKWVSAIFSLMFAQTKPNSNSHLIFQKKTDLKLTYIALTKLQTMSLPSPQQVENLEGKNMQVLCNSHETSFCNYFTYSSNRRLLHFLLKLKLLNHNRDQIFQTNQFHSDPTNRKLSNFIQTNRKISNFIQTEKLAKHQRFETSANKSFELRQFAWKLHSSISNHKPMLKILLSFSCIQTTTFGQGWNYYLTKTAKFGTAMEENSKTQP